MAIEIVDFPINSMVVFHSYVSLPEGITILYAYLSGMGIAFMWAPLFIAWYRTPKNRGEGRHRSQTIGGFPNVVTETADRSQWLNDFLAQKDFSAVFHWFAMFWLGSIGPYMNLPGPGGKHWIRCVDVDVFTTAIGPFEIIFRAGREAA